MAVLGGGGVGAFDLLDLVVDVVGILSEAGQDVGSSVSDAAEALISVRVRGVVRASG